MQENEEKFNIDSAMERLGFFEQETIPYKFDISMPLKIYAQNYGTWMQWHTVGKWSCSWLFIHRKA